MKRKNSITFCLVCLWLIFLLLSYKFNVYSRIPMRLSDNFSLLNCIRVISTALLSLMPVAIIILLVINQKKNIAKFSVTILTIFGVVRIVAFMLDIIRLVDAVLKNIDIILITHMACNLIISLSTIVLIFLCAKNIKTGQINESSKQSMKILNIIIIAATVFYLFISFICRSYSFAASNITFVSLLTNIIVGFSLYLLPETLLDYQNCELVTKDDLIIIGIVAVCLVLFIAIFNAVNNNPGTGVEDGKCAICKGSGLVNTGFIKFEQCPVCKGSGVDLH